MPVYAAWLSPDRSALRVQWDDEDGPITEIDGDSIEPQEVDNVPRMWRLVVHPLCGNELGHYACTLDEDHPGPEHQARDHHGNLVQWINTGQSGTASP
jgi:hypothetical protein